MRLNDIPEYLRNVTSGRPLPQAAIDEITHRYSLIGKSPLTDITMAQARLLEQHIDMPVYVGMRNWKPYIANVVRQMRDRWHHICRRYLSRPPELTHQRWAIPSRSARRSGPRSAVDFTEAWADHPLLIKAFAERLRSKYRELTAELSYVSRYSSPPTAYLVAPSRVPRHPLESR